MKNHIAPDFSVIITCYNKCATVGASIASARAQGNGTEVIVVDDGSTDGSQEVLQNANADLVVMHPANRGALSAYLTGLRVARGRYLVLLDGDDRLAEGILAALGTTGWLDDGTCIRLGMAVLPDSRDPPPLVLPLKRALIFRPGRLFTLSQSTGGTAYVFPRTLFLQVDQALESNWPDIVAQDHILPGMIGLIARRFIKVASCGYWMAPPDDKPRLSHKTARLHHDRLLSDHGLASAGNGPLRQSAFSRLLLYLAQIRRIHRLGRLYGVTTPGLWGLLASRRLRARTVEDLANTILPRGTGE